jgi:hypothetical protein
MLVAVTAGAVALAVLMGAPATASGATAGTRIVQPLAGVDGTMVWGADVQLAKTNPLLSVQTFQTKVGRKLNATRDFLAWDSPFPTAYETGLQAQGTTVMLSVSSYRLSKAPVLWADIAAAQPGDPLYADMQSWADRMRDFGSTMYFTFQHEPEAATNKNQGTQADYIAAWRNFVTIVRGEGATNVRFIFISTGFANKLGPNDRRQTAKWYPGDVYVDAIGVDVYNWFTCRATVKNPWNSLAQLIEGNRQFGMLHPTKPIWVTEYASVEDPNQIGRRAQWLADAQALFKQDGYGQYVGALYFDLKKQCDWRVENDVPSRTAFATMGADPFYAGTVS